ncbi:hypothetical protein DXG01_009474, partial [Tephrocybe rancida]
AVAPAMSQHHTRNGNHDHITMMAPASNEPPPRHNHAWNDNGHHTEQRWTPSVEHHAEWLRQHPRATRYMQVPLLPSAPTKPPAAPATSPHRARNDDGHPVAPDHHATTWYRHPHLTPNVACAPQRGKPPARPHAVPRPLSLHPQPCLHDCCHCTPTSPAPPLPPVMALTDAGPTSVKTEPPDVTRPRPQTGTPGHLTNPEPEPDPCASPTLPTDPYPPVRQCRSRMCQPYATHAPQRW